MHVGLLAMNGDQHRRNRRIVKEPFGLRAISNYGSTIVRLTDELLADLASRAKSATLPKKCGSTCCELPARSCSGWTTRRRPAGWAT